MMQQSVPEPGTRVRNDEKAQQQQHDASDDQKVGKELHIAEEGLVDFFRAGEENRLELFQCFSSADGISPGFQYFAEGNEENGDEGNGDHVRDKRIEEIGFEAEGVEVVLEMGVHFETKRERGLKRLLSQKYPN